MKTSIILTAIYMFFGNSYFAAGAEIAAQIHNVRKIWDKAPHNAFTDLVRRHEKFYCSFREGTAHVSNYGKIRIISSSDTKEWSCAALLQKAGWDLRDPHMCVTADDRLMLVGGACRRTESPQTGSFVSFSDDGKNWSKPQIILQPGRWLWKVACHNGTAWGFSYAAYERKPELDLLKSNDGKKWVIHEKAILTEGYPTEVSLRFDIHGNAYALARKKVPAVTSLFGSSKPPYKKWNWWELKQKIGGPCLMQTPMGWIAAARIRRGNTHTAILRIDPRRKTCNYLLKLPSGGDCGYPGLVWHDDKLYVSYYSSHEKKTAIYMAQVSLHPHADFFTRVCTDARAGAYEAFPDVCRLSDGRLMCVFYAGYGHVALPKKELPKGGRISYCTSTNQGRTWKKAKTLCDTYDDDRDPSITQTKTGRIICNFFRLRTDENSKNAYTGLGSWMTCSENMGETWSKPKQISKDYYCSSPVRQLSDGRLVLGVYKEEKGRAWGAVTFSADDGDTWSQPIDINNGGMTLDAETDIIELKNGSLYAAQRARGQDMAYSISADSGKNWTVSKPIGFPGHCPYLLRTVDNIILLAHRIPATSLHYSFDECRTWSENVQIDSVGGAYPSMVNLRDGSVLVVYYEEGTGSDIRAKRFRATPYGIRWIPVSHW